MGTTRSKVRGCPIFRLRSDIEFWPASRTEIARRIHMAGQVPEKSPLSINSIRRAKTFAGAIRAAHRKESQPTMFRSWRIGTAFGIGIYIHPTFWLLPLLFVMQSYSTGGLNMVGMMLVLLAGAMGCVVLHELGHAQMARYFGIRTRD